MLLSLLGSAVSFTISTTATGNRILDEQLAVDARRMSDAWARRERELADSAMLLAEDRDLAAALVRDRAAPSGEAVLNLDRRVLPVRDRFDLDQVLIVTTEGRVPVNMVTQSALSRIDTEELVRQLEATSSSPAALVQIGATVLLVARADVQIAGMDERLGRVYTVLDVAEETNRLRRSLELASEIQLAAEGNVLLASLPDTRGQPLGAGEGGRRFNGMAYRVQIAALPLGGRTVQLALLGNEETINAVVATGFRVMLISSLVTLGLLVAGGVLLARNFTRPIRALAAVAGAVAAGDLSQRANVDRADELGQLGRAFDQATSTIADLLDRQVQMVGELEAILHSIADGVLAIDTDERVVQVNPAAAQMLGLRAEKLMFQPITLLLRSDGTDHDSGMARIVEQLRSELTHSDFAPTEERVALGNRMVRLKSAPIIGSGQACRGAVLVVQDITREVAADQAKSDFIAIASHELRTPLTSIQGYIDLLGLLDTSNLRPEQQTSLLAIQRQTNNLVQLVNDLLEMARIEQGEGGEESEWVAPAPLIGELVDALRPLAARRQISLAVEIAPELPDLWITPEHLRRIVTNLLSNALKYSYDGGEVALRVAVVPGEERLPGRPLDQLWPYDDQPTLAVLVRDTGVGIRAADQSRLFTRFFRSYNPRSTEAGGTGLGLTITRALVLHHRGQIGFESAEGQGSCFWVRFPLGAGEEEPAPNDEGGRTLVATEMAAL